MEFPASLKISCVNRVIQFRIASPRWSISINKNDFPCQNGFDKADIISGTRRQTYQVCNTYYHMLGTRRGALLCGRENTALKTNTECSKSEPSVHCSIAKALTAFWKERPVIVCFRVTQVGDDRCHSHGSRAARRPVSSIGLFCTLKPRLPFPFC